MYREQIIDIINITYLRIMQLNFSYKFIAVMVDNNIIANSYPNLVWSLQSSFATDAYATISGLLSTGNYSFGRLGQENKKIKDKLKIAENDITLKIDDFREIRNKMFCHAVHKKSFDAIYRIFDNFESVYNILYDLHGFCCCEFSIDDNDYGHYSDVEFEKLNEEMYNFHYLLISGNWSVIDNINKHIIKSQGG